MGDGMVRACSKNERDVDAYRLLVQNAEGKRPLEKKFADAWILL
jgi:hypothetical protein